MIDPRAAVSPKATIGKDVTVAPFAVIDDNVVLGDSCRIGPHTHVTGRTTIGPRTRIHAGAVVGDEPQDYSFDPASPSYTEIGADCVIREYVTIHRGAKPESKTVIGDGCMLMAFCHVAHNCIIGDQVAIANCTTLGGHVEIGRRAVLSANIVFHQFVHVGPFTMITAGQGIAKDVIPYAMVARGNKVVGPNTIGLKRAGFDEDARKAIKSSIKTLFFSGLRQADAISEIESRYGEVAAIRDFLTFVGNSKRGLLTAHERER